MLSTFHSIRYFYNCLSPLQVMPKPVLTLLDLSFPLASSDLGAETLENEFMMNNFHLSQVHFSHPILYAYHTTVVLFNCTCQHVSCIWEISACIIFKIGLLLLFITLLEGLEFSCSCGSVAQKFTCLSLQIPKRMEEVTLAGLDTSSLDDEAFNLEAAQDRCILRLIASCCNGKFLQLIHKCL